MFKRNDGKGVNALQNRFTALLKTALRNRKIDYITEQGKRYGKEFPLVDYVGLAGDEYDFIQAIIDYDVLKTADYLAWTIENCILLHLFQFPIDLSKIAFAKQYSEFLSFVIEPDNYDFSKVDLDNYMWQNLIYSDEYMRFFVEHRELILTDNLKTSLTNGLASNNVQKIVYGILVDKNDLRRYNI